MQGVVKFFNKVKNFGFITPEGEEKDIFFHGSKVLGSVEDNDNVSFEIAEGRKGPEAINVEKNTPDQEPQEETDEAEEDEQPKKKGFWNK